MKTLVYLFCCSLFLFSCIDYSFPDPIDNTANPPIVDNNSNPYLFDFSKDIDLIIYNQMSVPYRNDNYSYSFKKWDKHDGCEFVYETNRYLKFENGVLIEEKTIDNTPKG